MRNQAIVPTVSVRAAGNFIYIAAADLIPEVARARPSRHTIAHIVAFLGGIALLGLLAAVE